MQPSTTYRAILGQALGKLRERIGMTQQTFAAQMRVTQPTWSRIERGRSSISVEQLIQASRFLNVRPSDLVKYVEDSANQLEAQGIRVFDAPPEERKSSDTIQIAAAALGGIVGGLIASRLSDREVQS